MLMYSRTVPCDAPGCESHAEYKVAAPWSAGRFSELKTYGLACQAHADEIFQAASTRRKVHPPSTEELQGELGLFVFVKGGADKGLERAPNPG